MFIGPLPDGTDPGADRNQAQGIRVDSPASLTITSSYIGYNGLGGITGNNDGSVLTVTYNEVFSNDWLDDAHDGIDLNGQNGLVQYNLSRDNRNSSMSPNNAPAQASSSITTDGTGGNRSTTPCWIPGAGSPSAAAPGNTVSNISGNEGIVARRRQRPDQQYPHAEPHLWQHRLGSTWWPPPAPCDGARLMTAATGIPAPTT
jgi:hypothetical protein